MRELVIHYADGGRAAWQLASVNELRDALQTVYERPTREVWLDWGSDAALAALISYPHGRAVLTPMEGDGMHSIASDEWAANDTFLTFLLSNGQADEYPARWTVPVADALRAVEYFYEHRELDPWVRWDND